MLPRYIITFTSIDSDIYDIEMMDLGGIPLFFHTVKNLQEIYSNINILVEEKNQKVIDYCKDKGIETISKEQILNSDYIVNAYQPFLYKKSKYAILVKYRKHEVKDFQSYWFALYINDCLTKYEFSGKIKKEKVDLILSKSYCNEEICFIGDSLIENWDIKEINGQKIFNVGIGDLTSIECKKWISDIPFLSFFKIFFIIVGTNDLKYKIDVVKIVNNVKSIINIIHKNNKKAKIIYSLVPNVYRRWDRYNDEIVQLNILLQQTLENEAYIFNPSFLNNQYGELDKANTIDGLHFSKKGYKKIKEMLESQICKI